MVKATFTCGLLEMAVLNRTTVHATATLGVYTLWLLDRPVKLEDFLGTGKGVLPPSLRRTVAALTTIR